jgi:ABC transporter substrate binding protein
VDVIVAPGVQAVRAAKQSTTTIPIIFPTAGDAVASGLVASLARPGGNITGLTILSPELSGRRLELLRTNGAREDSRGTAILIVRLTFRWCVAGNRWQGGESGTGW